MDLFGDTPVPTVIRPPASGKRSELAVEPVTASAEVTTLAASLTRRHGERLRLGTSSWNFPGWAGLVWADTYAEATLSKRGLSAYAAHPLLQAVSLDRAFYKPLSAEQYAAYAAQVPAGFRFSVKGPSLVCDAVQRDESGRARLMNPHFLDPALAVEAFVRPALAGLGERCGPLVFQLSPLPHTLLCGADAMNPWLDQLDALLAACAAELAAQRTSRPDPLPDVALAVEVRNREWIEGDTGKTFAALLKRHGTTYCLGLHAKMPPIEAQLPILRGLWPGPLVCRWSLHRKHGAFGYGEAKGLYEPFDTLVDPDPDTRARLARVIAGTLAAGFSATVTINNKAEGSAPLSVIELANAVLAFKQPLA